MKITLLILRVAMLIMIVASCQSPGPGHKAGEDAKSESPVLAPEASLKKIKLDSGFAIKLVAREPLVHTPVAMAFDDSLRIWVVEMTDYQPLNKSDHDALPLGKIVILEDRDSDGIMDQRKVFMDSLVMPRAICLVDNGVLIATPPKLWFVEINHDRPGKKTLVDSAYTVSGNPEGQTNGLLRSLDNWIYSAGFGSSKRYRRVHGKWLTEKTILRGQWGISQDDYGHLFYNNNSQNLLGDYLMPGMIPPGNTLKNIAGYNEEIVPDNRVYPIRATPGVNRGYKVGILDDSSRLVDLTAACGPVIYRGSLLGKDYEGNAFICEPAANLIKRDVLGMHGDVISGVQAYQGREFLASTDERFRPVNLYNGPDGALYVVDMYRGVIQDNLSLTDYLKHYVLRRKLFQPVDCGRIYKVVVVGKTSSPVPIPHDPGQLTGLLANSNGWVRDHAQQRLVDENDFQAIPALRALLRQPGHPLTVIDALWTLEGLEALTPDDISPLLIDKDRHVREAVLSAMAAVVNQTTYRDYLPAISLSMARNDSLLAPEIAYALGMIYAYAPQAVNKLRGSLIKQYPDNPLVADAIISGLKGQEKRFLRKYPDTTTSFHQRLAKFLADEVAREKNHNMARLRKQYPKGSAIFTTVCQTCHGADGNGIRFLAPPLNGSDWVQGDRSRLVSIVLYGLTGPVMVKGKLYQTPEVIADMPGFGNGNKFSDTAIAELLSFLREAWGNNANEVNEKEVIKIRNQFHSREKAFTMHELKQLFH